MTYLLTYLLTNNHHGRAIATDHPLSSKTYQIYKQAHIQII